MLVLGVCGIVSRSNMVALKEASAAGIEAGQDACGSHLRFKTRGALTALEARFVG